MKNKVIRNFSIFVVFWLVIVFARNLVTGQSLFNNFPWEVLLIFLLALIRIMTNLNKKIIWIIYFVVFFIFMLLTGGYYNWTSLLIFAGMSVFMSWITYFIGGQFLKGKQV
ncbi:hypothetical protein EGT49_01325 [Companilactobacillus suantsaicola]|uniref:Uncharacterized protein n=1 Tax=Companilactobacillus suantsaicola TaxID=2487723 RepID=A0A4Z0JQ78_9LACO|nr:hypothetical protein [Companilactobacillus suantsaicola]TGD25124.1 hypothetical protein EGT49_01325 [Companilactobacillus suantsaicola]